MITVILMVLMSYFLEKKEKMFLDFFLEDLNLFNKW